MKWYLTINPAYFLSALNYIQSGNLIDELLFVVTQFILHFMSIKTFRSIWHDKKNPLFPYLSENHKFPLPWRIFFFSLRIFLTWQPCKVKSVLELTGPSNKQKDWKHRWNLKMAVGDWIRRKSKPPHALFSCSLHHDNSCIKRK